MDTHFIEDEAIAQIRCNRYVIVGGIPCIAFSDGNKFYLCFESIQMESTPTVSYDSIVVTGNGNRFTSSAATAETVFYGNNVGMSASFNLSVLSQTIEKYTVVLAEPSNLVISCEP